VLMLQGGGRSLEDLRELKDEGGLMELIGREEIPGPDTVGDWLRRMGDPKSGQLGLEGLDRVRDKINERVLKKDGIKEYTLDADATEIIGEKTDALFCNWTHCLDELLESQIFLTHRFLDLIS